MALRALLKFRNIDSTADINSQTANVITRAVTKGGAVALSASAMTLALGSFTAHGPDGMVSTSDAVETLTLPAPPPSGSAVYHVVLFARYVPLSAPIQQLVILDNATYTTSVDRDYFISFGKLTIPSGATTASMCTLDLSTSDLSDQLGKSTWRPPVASVGDLPASTAVATNRTGEVRVVVADGTGALALYGWDGTAWVPAAGGTATLAHLATREFAEAERARNEERSGLLASTIGLTSNPAPGRFGYPLFNIFQPQGSVTAVGVRALKALVNGHYVETRAQVVTTLTSPVGPDRYDIVYLVVTRTALANPNVDAHPTYPSGNLTRAQLDDLAGLVTPPSSVLTAGKNYDLLNQEISFTSPSAYAQVNASLVYASDVDPTFWLSVYSRGLGNGETAILNGVTYTLQSPLESGDPYLFTAPDGATVDGIRYMIPLLVFRRTSTETSISTHFSDGQRQTFPVHPNTRSAQRTMLEAAQSIERGSDTSSTTRSYLLSGVRSGIEQPITGDGGNGLTMPEMSITLGGQTFSVNGTGPLLPPTAGLTGTTSNDVAYDFVYLRLIRTLYPDNAVIRTSESQTSPSATLYTTMAEQTSSAASMYAAVGEGASVQLQWVAVRLTSASFYPSLIEEAMADPTLLGFAKFSASTNFLGTTSDDPAQWVRELSLDDLRVSIDVGTSAPHGGAARLIPIALVRRRNGGTFSNTNLNGTVGRPDGKSSNLGIIYPDEILDLRNRPIDNAAELQEVLSTTMSQLLRGTLQTQFSAHPLAPRLFAGKHLLLARISTSGASGYDTFAAPDNYRGLWSSANEPYPVAQVFSPAINGTFGVVTWSSAGTPSLTVRAPSGAYVLTGQNPDIAPRGELRPRWSTGPWKREYFRPTPGTPLSDPDPTALFPDASPNRAQQLGDTYAPTLLCVSAQQPGQIVLNYPSFNDGSTWYPYVNLSVFEPFYHASTYNWTVVASDGAGAFTGNPITLNKTGAGYGSRWVITQPYSTNTGNPFVVASYWCVWPQPVSADSDHLLRYGANKGFLLEPETVHGATLTVGATVARVCIGMPFADIEITLSGSYIAGTAIPLSQGTLFGALPSGQFPDSTGVVFYGLDSVIVTPPTLQSGLVAPKNVAIAANGLSGSFALNDNYAAGTVVRVRALVRPVNPGNLWDYVYWIEVNKANRHLRGLFRFGTFDCKNHATASSGTARITAFMDPLIGNPLAPTAGFTSLVVPFRDCGAPNVLSLSEWGRGNATTLSEGKMGLYGTVSMYRRVTATPTADLVCDVNDPQTFGAATGAAVTNLMSPLLDVVFNAGMVSGITAQDIVFVGVVQDMLNTASTLVISYTAGAYQGMITGAPSLTDPPVTGLRDRVLGKAMALGPVHSTTSGSGLTSYVLPVLPRITLTPSIGGTMVPPTAVTADPTQALSFGAPSFRYQQFGALNTMAVRPDRGSLRPSPWNRPMLTNIVQHLPGGVRTVCLPDPQVYGGEETYDYQELTQNSSAPTGSGGVLRTQPASDMPSDGSQPIAVGDVYAYPASWSPSDVTNYESQTFYTEEVLGVRTSRGITLGSYPLAPFGSSVLPIFNSYLIPANTAYAFAGLVAGNGTQAGLMPPSFTMEADPYVQGVPYAQAFGVLVNPQADLTPEGLRGKLHVLVGTNASVGTNRTAYQNQTGTIIPAGGAFDAIIPVGRPVVARR